MDENFLKNRRLWSAVLLQAFDDIEAVKKASENKDLMHSAAELIMEGIKKKDIYDIIGIKPSRFTWLENNYKRAKLLYVELIEFFYNKNDACRIMCLAANVNYDALSECARKKLKEIDI
jgi:hypothetical protein